jgi:hypothetical protein
MTQWREFTPEERQRMKRMFEEAYPSFDTWHKKMIEEWFVTPLPYGRIVVLGRGYLSRIRRRKIFKDQIFLEER